MNALVNEHPLLFSAEMVRAILEDRKTVTRRLSKNPNHYMGWKKGDKIWVRETWAETDSDSGPCIAYRADGAGILVGREDRSQNDIPMYEDFLLSVACEPCLVDVWRPSIHMPKWASRITLELTADVRREPLQEKLGDLFDGEREAEREGFELHYGHSECIQFPAKEMFRRAWDSMNPKAPWNSNPTVSVIEFRRITP